MNAHIKQYIVRNSKINGVELNQSKGSPHIRFESVIIEDDLNLIKCSFKKGEFIDLKIMKKTSFKNSLFRPLGLTIQDCEFFEDSNFSNVFIDKGKIRNSCFHGNCYMDKGNTTQLIFDNCTFNSRSFFSYKKHSQLFGFMNCIFKDKFFMKKNILNENAYFIDCIFESDAEFFKSTFEDGISFKSSQFKGRALFNKTEFHSGPKMKDVKFTFCPEFHDSSLSQDADFRGASFKNFDDNEAPPSYRTLKHAMNKVSNKTEEARFHGFELKAIRKQPETTLTNRVFSLCYDLTSQYGQNYKRALGSFIVLNCIFMIIYMTMIPRKVFRSFDSFFIELLMALKVVLINIIAPFKLWFGRENEILIQVFGSGHTWYYNLGLATLTSLQTIISLTLITLFILAVRRAFKLN